MAPNPKWDVELHNIAARSFDIFKGNPIAKVGVAVDDAVKRDYFVPRLQALIIEHQWKGSFAVIPIDNSPAIEVRVQGNN